MKENGKQGKTIKPYIYTYNKVHSNGNEFFDRFKNHMKHMVLLSPSYKKESLPFNNTILYCLCNM